LQQVDGPHGWSPARLVRRPVKEIV
jgi:hypothetical protein